MARGSDAAAPDLSDAVTGRGRGLGTEAPKGEAAAWEWGPSLCLAVLGGVSS